MKKPEAEVKLLERIFNLHLSLRLLEAGRSPFHNEAKAMIRKRIQALKNKKL